MSMYEENLTESTVTFGKYKDLTLTRVLRDRKYCKWLLRQDWFQEKYEYLYNRVLEYSPKDYFVTLEDLVIEDNLDLTMEEFFDSYPFFNLVPSDDLKINLTEEEKTCYSYYLELIDLLKEKIVYRQSKYGVNPYGIKAPTRWLKKFEQKYGLSRDVFKEFLSAHELLNIPYIVEDIKKMGGIEYKGARSFLIAKANSVEQEEWWEKKLKAKYGEDIGAQFQYKKCIFDFLCISRNTIYECKIGLKDFNEEQHRKYLITLGTYRIVYLIDRDCVVDMEKRVLYTTDRRRYVAYLSNIPALREPSKFDKLIEKYEVQEVENVMEFT